MNNSKGNILLVASVILIITGLFAYNSKDDTGQGLNPNENTSGDSTERTAPPPSQPSCDKCGARTVLRTNSKTKERFWGCSKFPRCKSTQDYLGGPVGAGASAGKDSDTNEDKLICCGKEMKLRANSKTKEQFWGCATYPRCPITKDFVSDQKVENSNKSKPNSLTDVIKSTINFRINASVAKYHLKQYKNPQFWSHQVHENLSGEMSGSKVHSYLKSKGFKSGPDMILTSLKHRQKRAYEYQFVSTKNYFEISESRYSDLKRYYTQTGNSTFWVISKGGVPLDNNNQINPSFVPHEAFVIPYSKIDKNERYNIDDNLREKYSFLKHIIWVETN